MSGVWIFLVLLMAAIIFIIEPGEALLPKLKCWECDSDDRWCVTNPPISTTCGRGQYCFKFISKLLNPSDGMDRIKHKCVSREEVLDHGYALNECVEYKTVKSTYTRCICDKNDCNSGNEFIPTFKLSPGLTCWSYEPSRPSVSNLPITTTNCSQGYYCYKYLLKGDGNGTRHIQRGCIHSKLAARIGVNINQCGEFENDYDKYPFCIYDQDKCNSGNFTLENSVKPIKPVKPTPCPPSSKSGTNTFQQISLILIWILA